MSIHSSKVQVGPVFQGDLSFSMWCRRDLWLRWSLFFLVQVWPVPLVVTDVALRAPLQVQTELKFLWSVLGAVGDGYRCGKVASGSLGFSF